MILELNSKYKEALDNVRKEAIRLTNLLESNKALASDFTDFRENLLVVFKVLFLGSKVLIRAPEAISEVVTSDEAIKFFRVDHTNEEIKQLFLELLHQNN